ncbi:Protein belonging to kish family [Babesia bigemina]|uniref:Protein kish n=1 Tax=Babesia bigemina TaxID=5866 RepID=A0A061D8U0_BABBI|nr:Protein belonging to kish family [Babesia bigemina]CDR96963.1 Protein belonging to kish family [Babesia bigemina]|eukprot:XP_012769149.1 Protein belonging to kish family [Babesia bigemina]
MTALLSLPSFIVVLLLTICTSSYLKVFLPNYFNARRPGFFGLLGKLAVIGDRLSPYVAFCCIVCAFWILFMR